MQQLRTQFFLISIVGFFLFLMLYGFFPFLRKPLVRENNILELLQVGLYVAAIWLSIRYLANFPKGWISKAYMAIPLVGFVGVLEEISYGNTIFPVNKILFSQHLKLAHIKIDSVHDLFEVLYIWWGPIVVWGLVIFFGACIVMGVGALLLKLRTKKKGLIEAAQEAFCYLPPLGFFLICGMGLVVALILDLDTQGISLISLFEELLEMVAALALFYAARAIPHSSVKF